MKSSSSSVGALFVHTVDNDTLQWEWVRLRQLDHAWFFTGAGLARLRLVVLVLPIEAVHFRVWAAEMSKLLGLPIWQYRSHIFPPVQASVRLMVLVKPAFRSGLQTASVWGLLRVAIGLARSVVTETNLCPDPKLTWLRERVCGVSVLLRLQSARSIRSSRWKHSRRLCRSMLGDSHVIACARSGESA